MTFCCLYFYLLGVVVIIGVVVGSRLSPEVVVASVFGAGGFASDFVRGLGVSSLGCRVVDLCRVVERWANWVVTSSYFTKWNN